MDGELHHAVRRLVMSYLTRSRVNRVGERLEAGARELVPALVERSGVDLVADLVEPLVLDGIMSVMEVPEARRGELNELTRRMLGMLEPDLPSEVARRAEGAAKRAALLFERDSRAGTATGLHAVLDDAARQGAISARLVRSTLVVMLHGGYENPLNHLACIVAWAVAQPERFRDLAASAPAALSDEILRVYSPVRRAGRWVSEDFTADGDSFQRGERVWIDLESANLDHRRFSCPEEVDTTRKPGHLGFGYGRHLCVGAGLARLEGRALVQALACVPADVLRQYTVAWQDGFIARGPTKIVRA